jgi:hypothetical protein
MLCRKRVAVYCENHTEHTNIPRVQKAEFYYAKHLVHTEGLCRPMLHYLSWIHMYMKATKQAYLLFQNPRGFKWMVPLRF